MSFNHLFHPEQLHFSDEKKKNKNKNVILLIKVSLTKMIS